MQSKEFTVKEILEMGPGIDNIATIKPPAGVTSYLLGKMLKKLYPEYREANVAHNALIVEHGHKEADGNHHINPGDEKWDAYKAARDALFARKVNLEWEKVPIPEKVEGILPLTWMFLDEFLEMVPEKNGNTPAK